MKVLVLNGSMDGNPEGTAYRLSNTLANLVYDAGAEPTVLHLSDAGIPILTGDSFSTPPGAVKRMVEMLTDADRHIWLSPLYHGGMTGALKNCLDWVELTANYPIPYLSGKVIGLVCWADGIRSILGIQNMETVARSLRAWTNPYNVCIVKSELYTINDQNLNQCYIDRLNKLVRLQVKSRYTSL